MKKIIIWIFLLLMTLKIDSDVINSFERVEVEYGEKAWHSHVIYYPSQGFFNAIWLTDKEFGKLLSEKKVETKYMDAPISIQWEKQPFNQSMELK